MSAERTEATLLVRSAAVTALGVVARVAGPVLLVAITWWFGPAVVGAYLVASSVAALALTLTHAGWSDAMLLFASREVERSRIDAESARRLKRAVSHGIAGAVGCAALAGLMLSCFARPASNVLLASSPDLPDALRWIAVSLPFAAFSQVAVVAARVRLRMGDEVVVLGFLQPALLLGFAAVASGRGLVALAAAFAASRVAGAAVSVVLLARHHRLADLMRAACTRPDPAMARHALRQAAQQTLTQLTGKVDVLALAAAGASAPTVALYGTASHVAAALAQARLIWSSAYTPLAVRHLAGARMEDLAVLLRRAARLTTFTAAIAVLVVLVLRRPILSLFDPSYGGGGAWIFVLLASAYVGCASGLAGNTLAAAGRVDLALWNATAAAVVTTATAWLLAPLGPSGVAAATLAGAVVLGALQVVELRRALGLRFPHATALHTAFAASLAMAAAASHAQPHWSEWSVACLALGTLLALIGVAGRLQGDAFGGPLVSTTGASRTT